MLFQQETILTNRFRKPNYYYYYYYWWSGTKSLGTAATSGLLYKPQMRDEGDCGAIGELAGETEVLGENLPQRHFVHHKIHMTRPGLEPRAAAVGSQRLTA
jgi:hypothetical protein